MLKTLCRSGAFWLLVCLVTGTFVLLAPPAFLTARLVAGRSLERSARWCIWAYGRSISRVLAFLVPVSVERQSCPPPSSPAIYVFNHLSMLDLFLITLVIPSEIVSPARHWPFAVPVFGPAMRLGRYIDVERESGDELLAKARALLTRGISLAVFPEGTRSRSGKRARFRSGAFKLATITGVDVVPVRICGTGKVLAPRSWLIRFGSISLFVFDPVDPEPFRHTPLGHRALSRMVLERMDSRLPSLASPHSRRCNHVTA